MVVTSDWHAARVRYLAQVIWGPGYQVAVEPLTGETVLRPLGEIARWEAGLLAVSRRWFAAVRRATTLRSPPSWPGTTRSTLTIRRPHWPSSRQ